MSPSRPGTVSAIFSAQSGITDRPSSWTSIGKKLPTVLDRSDKGLGVWVYGDGKGEMINLQLLSPTLTSNGLADHYIDVDFTGWKYFEFAEPEGDRISDYDWPYITRRTKWAAHSGSFFDYAASAYIIWGEYNKVDTFNLYYNNLPTGERVTCFLSPIKMLPLQKITLSNPSIKIGGETITFPVKLESGSYIEFRSLSDCKVYDAEGNQVQEVKPLGSVPILEAGENNISFKCESAPGVHPRVTVTVIAEGIEVR
jgi:hypothetical protein